MIFWQIQRIKKALNVKKIVVATSTNKTDDPLVEYLEEIGVEVHRGSLEDVHSRFLEVVIKYPEYSNIVRLTGDCPFVMPVLLQSMITEFESIKPDYYSNCNPPSYPDGLDVEIFSHSAFVRMSAFPLTNLEKEHVTLRFRNDPVNFKLANRTSSSDESMQRWTVDYEEDLIFAKNVFTAFKSREEIFDYDELLTFCAENPNINNKISGSFRNIRLSEEMRDRIE
jgi:spore coat polysaccharide biosynthesis protein SpsF (cytidylyltransferase family)